MERKLTNGEKAGIVVATILGIPVLLIMLGFIWQILIYLGFDVAPR